MAIVVVVAIGLFAAWRSREGARLNRALAAVAWALLLFGIPANVLFVYRQGQGPLLC